MATRPARILLVTAEGCLDAGAPHHAADPARPPAGTLVVDPAVDPQALLVRDAAGGWRVHPTWFWSALNPLAPAAPAPDAQLAAAWDGLHRWRELPAEEVAACQALCGEFAHGAGDVLAILSRVAATGAPRGLAPLPGPSSGIVERPPLPALATPHDVAAWVGDADGLGVLYGASFWPRAQQAELAAAVVRALDAGQPLLAEAGTGTGKTLAYLVALLVVLRAGSGRAVISTYSRTLQRQILDGDLPRLVAPDQEPAARLLMGRANYLCLRQRNAYLTRPRETPRDALKTAAFRLWLTATTEGLREEIADHPLLGEDAGRLFSGVQPCTPDCHADRRCFVARARRLARQARLVVVNHALLLADHAADGQLIGPYEHLIVDEAHRLPAVALEASTVRLDHRRLRGLEELVGTARSSASPPEVPALLASQLAGRPGGERAAAAATHGGKAVGRALRGYADWWRRASRDLAPPPDAVPGQRVRVPDKSVAFAPLREATMELLAALAEAAGAVAGLNQQAETLDEMEPATLDLLLRCAQAGLLLQTLEQDVRFVTSDPSDRWVTWLEPAARDVVAALGATPLQSGPLLRDLWQGREVAPVATSATLAVGGDFGFMLEELGLTGRRPRTDTIAVPSPFAWEEQACCLAPEHIPDPDRTEFATAVAEVLAALRRAAPRQTLVLFTSYRLLQDVGERLAADAAFVASGELLVQQPRMGADTLRDRFRRSRGAMLLGTSTFWEGVDFPGESLEIVVVTKLPFLVPSDPWVAARCEQLRAAGDDPFRTFMLRDAVLRLRQGVGRLLRRRDDRGVILLLDNRLITRGYGATFRDALPTAVRWLPHHGALADAARDFLDDRDRGNPA